MKRKLAAIAFAIALMPVAAHAQERVGDAALGALSGALVLGPVGAVAGAFVGYAAGPNIASAWGVRRSQRTTYSRRPPRQASQVGPASSPGQPGWVGSRQATPAPGHVAEGGPAQSAVNVAVAPQGAPAATAAPPAAAPGGGVPVQGFE
jgi:hypothetical protein